MPDRHLRAERYPAAKLQLSELDLAHPRLKIQLQVLLADEESFLATDGAVLVFDEDVLAPVDSTEAHCVSRLFSTAICSCEHGQVYKLAQLSQLSLE